MKMELFVANCKKQTQIFTYRLPSSGTKSIPIRIGEQIRVPGIANKEDIDAVIKQHTIYGMINVSEIDRTKPFVGMCYSVDTKIRVETIIKAMKHNDNVLTDEGKQLRRNAAVASNNLIEKHLHESNQISGGEAELAALEMTIEEENPKGGRDDGLLKEGIKVGHDLENTETSYEKGRGKNSRARGKRSE